MQFDFNYTGRDVGNPRCLWTMQGTMSGSSRVKLTPDRISDSHLKDAKSDISISQMGETNKNSTYPCRQKTDDSQMKDIPL